MKRTNYLNNKDLLLEIHKSKSSYCSYVDDSYAQYDIILPSVEKINVRTIAEAKRNKAKRLSTQDYEARKAAGEGRLTNVSADKWTDLKLRNDLEITYQSAFHGSQSRPTLKDISTADC